MERHTKDIAFEFAMWISPDDVVELISGTIDTNNPLTYNMYID